MERELGAAECFDLSPFSNSPPPFPRLLPSDPSNRLEDRESGSKVGDQHCPSPAGSLCRPEVGKAGCKIFRPPGVLRRGRVGGENRQC